MCGAFFERWKPPLHQPLPALAGPAPLSVRNAESVEEVSRAPARTGPVKCQEFYWWVYETSSLCILDWSGIFLVFFYVSCAVTVLIHPFKISSAISTHQTQGWPSEKNKTWMVAHWKPPRLHHCWKRQQKVDLKVKKNYFLHPSLVKCLFCALHKVVVEFNFRQTYYVIHSKRIALRCNNVHLALHTLSSH